MITGNVNPNNSQYFRETNTIFYKTGILHASIWPDNSTVDMIDVNQNQKADMNDRGYQGATIFSPYIVDYPEPALKIPMAELKKFAERHGKEVLTQNDLDEPGTQTLRVISRAVFGGRRSETQVLSEGRLKDIVRQEEPLEKNAKWAIDTVTNEFLIYEAKPETNS